MMVRKMVTLALICSGAVMAKNDLLTTAKAWYSTADSYGSIVDTTGGLFKKDGSVATTFTLAKKESDSKWPYIEMVCETPTVLTGTKSIKINYSCTEPLLVKLSQTDFGPQGNETYSHYQVKLPAGTDLTTVIPITKFAQPDWTPDESRSIPLKLESVSAIYFTPELSVDTGGKATVSVSSLKLLKK